MITIKYNVIYVLPTFLLQQVLMCLTLLFKLWGNLLFKWLPFAVIIYDYWSVKASLWWERREWAHLFCALRD